MQVATGFKVTALLLGPLFGVTACSGGGGNGGSGSNERPPVAIFSAAPISGQLPLAVQFDSAGSTEGASVQYYWDLGDQATVHSAQRHTHVYTSAGSFAATLVVTDVRNGVSYTSRTSRTIEVSARQMPNLIGRSQTEAMATLAAIGLPLTSVTPILTGAAPPGSVISQAPPAGEQLTQTPNVRINVAQALILTDVYVLYGSSSWEYLPDRPRVVGDVVNIYVRNTSSLYEIAQIVARVGGTDTPLAFTPTHDFCRGGPCPGFAGTVSLAGQPVGDVTLEIRALDVVGNEAARTFTLIHDNRPLLTVTQPLPSGAFLGAVPIDASCSDDTPCVVEVGVGGTIYASGEGSLDGSIDLSTFANNAVDVVISARDERNPTVRQTRRVYIEEPGRLSVVGQVPGDILDVRGSRVLYALRDATGDRLVIRDRTSGTEEQYQAVGHTIRPRAFLLSVGALFESLPPGPSVRSATLYRQGVATNLGQITGTPYWADGDAIIIQGTTLRRIDGTSGAIETVTTAADPTGTHAVLADGTVVFSAGSPSYQLHRHRAGVQSALTNAPTFSHTSPQTDGVNTAFIKSVPDQTIYSIALLDGTTETTLVSSLSYVPVPVNDYAVANGWVAFTSPGPQQERQVHVRSPGPAGVIQQRTQYANSSRIETLRDNGELMLINQSRRHFSDGVSLVPVSSSNGKSYIANGTWLLAIGGTLFTVDTSD